MIYTFFIFFKRTRCLYKVLYTKGSPFTPKGEHLTIGFTRFCMVENHSYGQEYWTSRELYAAMGYSTYQKFSRVISKAIEVAKSKGMDVNDHFNQTVEMVRLGSGTFRKVENLHLSRMACMIVAENADSKKSQVQMAREYFSQQVTAKTIILICIISMP